MPTILYEVTGLTCGGCVNRVQQALTPLADEVKVTLSPPQATLINPQANLNVLNAALANIGNYQLQTIANTQPNKDVHKSWFAIYYPLLLIIGFIMLVTVLAQFTTDNTNTSFDWQLWMRHFMAGFFVVFAFFKLLDIKGFANSYAMYDLLASHYKPYGFIYPFIELGLGIAYLLNWQPIVTNSLTFIVMVFSSLGVIKSVLNKQQIRCACLGSVFNLPMSTVTIIEDLSMALMALVMLLQISL